MSQRYTKVEAAAETNALPEPAVKGNRRLVSQSTHHLVAVVIITALPLVGITAWATRFILVDRHLDTVSHIIGGRLTQPQAKAIDLIVSAMFAPLLFVCINWYWFAALRVTVFMEHSARPVSLLTLVEASKTERGSFNMVKIARLLKGGKRMAALGLVVLLSASAQTSFTNMIAYEAYDEQAPGQLVSLPPLLTTVLHNYFGGILSPYGESLSYGFQAKDWNVVQSQIVRLLSDISFHGARNMENDSYIGLNVTRASLDHQPPQVARLLNVPAYKLSAKCEPWRPTAFLVIDQPGYRPYTTVQFEKPDPASREPKRYQDMFPGISAAMTKGYVGEREFAAFLAFAKVTSVYLASTARYNLTEKHIETRFGNITHEAFDMLENNRKYGTSFEGEKRIMSVGGLECHIVRQLGSLNLTRGHDLAWNWSDLASESSWFEKSDVIELVLSQFHMDPVFQNPLLAGHLPGLGPVLHHGRPFAETEGGGSLTDFPNYETAVNNLLYATGEAERIVFEVKQATNTSSSGDSEVKPIQTMVKSQHYRITYVPPLLLLGLLSTLAAAVMTLFISLRAMRSHSFKAWRDVDTLRLLIDGVEGLHAESSIQQVQTAKNKRQESVARNMGVRYALSDQNDVVLRLQPVANRPNQRRSSSSL